MLLEEPSPLQVRQKVSFGIEETAGAKDCSPVPMVAAPASPLEGRQSRLKALIATLSCLWFALAVCVGATYYVAPNGSSGNTGLSTDSPWTLSYAKAHVGAGNTIIFLPGTYPTTTFSTPRIVYRALNKWTAVFSASSSTEPVVSFWPATATGCTLDGFQITGGQSGSGVYIVANNSTVQNCWIHHNGTSEFHYGLEEHDLLGITNQYNLIEYNGVTGSDHGIYCNGTNIVIRGNVLRYNAGAGAQVYRMSSQNLNEWTYNVSIYDNLMYGNKLNAMTMGSQSGSNYFIYNNTFIQNNANAVLYINDSSVGDFGRQRAVACCTNNIFVGSSIVQGRDPLFKGDHNYTNSSVSGVGFVNAAKGLYWLGSGSAARGRANTAIIPPVDFFGNPQSSVSDVGAFQYNEVYASDARTLDPSPANPEYWLLLAGTNGAGGSMAITPTNLSFGSLAVGLTSERTFTVQNKGTGTLSGSASVTAPFSIISGSPYSLAPGQTSIVTLQYSPTAPGTNSQTVNFMGTDSATATVTGVAIDHIPPGPPQNLRIIAGN